MESLVDKFNVEIKRSTNFIKLVLRFISTLKLHVFFQILEFQIAPFFLPQIASFKTFLKIIQYQDF